MPRLDLTRAEAIKVAGQDVLALKIGTARWQAPVILAPEVDGTMALHLNAASTQITVTEEPWASRGAWPVSVSQAGLAAGPVALVAPLIAGTGEVGQILALSPGLWVYDDNAEEPVLPRQWRRDGVAIAGATAETYTLVSADAGRTITATETAATSAGSRSATSAGLAVASSIAAPGQPTGLTATAGAGQVSLSWTAPASNGGAAITDYVVELSSNGGASWSTFSDGVSTATSAIVTGVAAGTAYQFRVSAANSAGTGAASSVATATPLAANLLSYPSDFSASAWMKSFISATADTITPSTTDASHRITQSAGTHALGSVMTFAVELAPSGYSYARVKIQDVNGNPANWTYVVVNLTTGAVVAAPGVVGAYTGASATVTDIGSGWYRVALTVTTGGSTAVYAAIEPQSTATTAASYTFAGNGTNGIKARGAVATKG